MNDIISNIEIVREKNNVNWMNILRLAYSLDPEKTKEIVKEIVKKDKEITKFLEELIK